MSWRSVPVLICDGCGTHVETDYHIKISPKGQKVVQRDPSSSPDRDFCCEACEGWWRAQFPETGPWGPAWDEREWWCEQVGPCSESVRIRTAHEEVPMIDVKVHFDTPEKV